MKIVRLYKCKDLENARGKWVVVKLEWISGTAKIGLKQWNDAYIICGVRNQTAEGILCYCHKKTRVEDTLPNFHPHHRSAPRTWLCFDDRDDFPCLNQGGGVSNRFVLKAE